ncbi:hypothetical protein ACFFWD_01075 [Bradyrhizobium erythrophlei]|uniref:hypothetical protein n=1 Tax=Bradyrhizobium erythrophlei TaxID=1437360 RepID=UPI0035E74858
MGQNELQTGLSPRGKVTVAEQRSTRFGKSALDLYIRPTLLWIDVGFAISCAAFVALFRLALLTVLPSYRWLVYVMQFFIIMAVLYGVSDVAEDLWLARLFLRRGEVAKYEAIIACALTDTKIVTISLSLLGLGLFVFLGRIFASSTS